MYLTADDFHPPTDFNYLLAVYINELGQPVIGGPKIQYFEFHVVGF